MSDEIKLIQHLLTNQKGHVGMVAYTSHTEFLVQIGKGKKGSYKTRWSFVGNLHQAVMYYNGINLDWKHKKRLVSKDLTPQVIARHLGWEV